DTAAFEADVLRQLEEMIRIHRNHPSVFVWSMCNEPFFTDGQTMPGVKRLLKRMVEKTHMLDDTRKAAVGGVQRPLGEERIDLIGDVAGYNGDGANIPDFQQPPVPSVVTEYGSTTADRPGQYIPGWGDLARDDSWKGRTWRSGQAIWCGFDHGSIFGSDMAKMGIVDYFRLPKRSWYWYRTAYTKVAPPEWPAEGEAARLLLKASKTDDIATDGTDDTQLIVVVTDADGRELSNTPTVTLRVVSGPGEFPTGKSITFRPDSDIRIQDGKAAIAFRSYYAGNTVVEASSPGLSSARLTLRFEGEQAYQEGVSPEVVDRPYIRYIKGIEGGEMQTYGLNNPTFASSSQKGHSPGLAADGDEESYWQPAAEENSAYWILDTERGLWLHTITARFAEKVNCRFKIEISADKETWQLVGDYSTTTGEKQDVRLSFEQPLKMRFVRFSFSMDEGSIWPRLAEVRVQGRVAD
ncbi:discoidin domain-containing protein, partial [Bacteroides sp. CAG:633]|uniref:discoidin domain-containing protein n=1 Tax=Bacteroides sp. CAG:633 TaxID=1262744 RepID=UPI002590B875